MINIFFHLFISHQTITIMIYFTYYNNLISEFQSGPPPPIDIRSFSSTLRH